MEEFRDLELTVAKFDIKASVVLQAYILDSYEYLKKLIAFSKQGYIRVCNLKIRFVKGANMESKEIIVSQKC